MIASNSNLPNSGFAPAGGDKHWKFARTSGARVPGEKRSFADHHGLEAETGARGAEPTRSEASHKIISSPKRLAARRRGISPTAMRWGSVEHFALG
jgi:hypothetical protein